MSQKRRPLAAAIRERTAAGVWRCHLCGESGDAGNARAGWERHYMDRHYKAPPRP